MGEFKIERSLEVNASAREIWDQLIDIRSWPEWKSFIKSASFAGDKPEIGLEFKIRIAIKGPAVPVTLTFCEIDEPNRIAWSGTIPVGIKAVRTIIMEEREGTTKVISRESLKGGMVWLLMKMITEKDLENIHDKWLKAIKERMEGNG